MKLTKAQLKNHQQACDLVTRHHEGGDLLTLDERHFIVAHWSPAAEHNITWIDAHFTNWELARTMMVETLNCDSRPVTTLDLCAGIGTLAFALQRREAWSRHPTQLTCYERNPTFVHVGMAVLPEAEWICGDMEDIDRLLPGRRFDQLISNPPFGKAGSLAYRAMEIGMARCETGVAILPQGMTPFRISGQRTWQRTDNPTYQKWSAATGIEFSENCGIDCAAIADFAHTKVMVEIVNLSRRPDPEPDDDDALDDDDFTTPATAAPSEQLVLL